MIWVTVWLTPFESVDVYRLVNEKSPVPDIEDDCVVGTPNTVVV